MITAEKFIELRNAVEARGYDDVDWAENITLPEDEDEFAREAIFVICNSGMKHTVARGIYNRVMGALSEGRSSGTAFGHKGKASAIDRIWEDRLDLYLDYLVCSTDEQRLAFCERLPWIGGITKHHLAKNFGAQVAKPDVHLQRLADRERCTPQQLCERLAAATGFKVPTVDTVLWRACAIGLIDSKGAGDG